MKRDAKKEFDKLFETLCERFESDYEQRKWLYNNRINWMENAQIFLNIDEFAIISNYILFLEKNNENTSQIYDHGDLDEN